MSLLLAAALLQAVPGAAWTEKTPEEAGLSREKLDALRDLAGGQGCVVRGGSLVYSWGDFSKSADVGAAAAPVLSWLLMAAVQEGKLAGLEARVSDLEPRLTGKNAAITWRHLAGQVSGYGLEEGPGEAWAADDAALALLGGTLMGKVFAQSGSEVFDARLRVPLRFQDPCRFEVPGGKDRSVRLEISARDFARFGLLVLRGGSWGRTPLLWPSLSYLHVSAPVPADLPRAAGKERARAAPGPGLTSFCWWVNGLDAQRRQLFVDGPGDLVAALGDGGRQALWILPSRDLVVSWSGASIGDLERCPGRPDAALNRAVRSMAASASR